jgi:hypothetical protein
MCERAGAVGAPALALLPPLFTQRPRRRVFWEVHIQDPALHRRSIILKIASIAVPLTPHALTSNNAKDHSFGRCDTSVRSVGFLPRRKRDKA